MEVIGSWTVEGGASLYLTAFVSLLPFLKKELLESGSGAARDAVMGEDRISTRETGGWL